MKQVPVDPLHCLSGTIRNRIEIIIGLNSNKISIKEKEQEDNRFPHFWKNEVYFNYLYNNKLNQNKRRWIIKNNEKIECDNKLQNIYYPINFIDGKFEIIILIRK